MKTVYRVLAYILAVEVVLQAMVYAIAGFRCREMGRRPTRIDHPPAVTLRRNVLGTLSS
jgi:cytochrome bd-type quinol oxidase subunit 1